jgi:hypothetical protein
LTNYSDTSKCTCGAQYYWIANVWCIVFISGSVVSPIQDPGSGFFSGHRVVRVIFLNQNNVVLIIQKSQRIATRFLTGSCRVNHILPGQPSHRVNRVTPGFSSPYFFFNPARFQSRVGRIPGWPAGPGFKTIVWW